MGGLPAGVQVDIEFTAGVWTNVTAFVDAQATIQTKFGRTNSAGTPQVATASLRLENFDGRFTPNNFASPYYPNVQPRKRLRVSYGSGASPRFVGYIKQWLPTLSDGLSYVTVSATDRFDALSKFTLLALTDYAVAAVTPSVYLPLNDPFSTSFTDPITGNIYTPVFSGTAQSPIPPTMGTANPYPLPEGRPGMGFVVPSGTLQGGFWSITSSAMSVPLATVSIAGWVTAPLIGGSWSFGFGIYSPVAGESFTIQVGGTGATATFSSGGTTSASAIVANDGVAHHWAATWDGTNVLVYQDGALAGSTAGARAATQPANLVNFNPQGVGAATAAGTGIYAGIVVAASTLSSGQVASLYNAGANGFSGEASGARATRILGYAGITAPNYNIATGAETMGAAVISTKSVPGVLEDIALTEGGGSAVFVDFDGKVRFIDRTYRSTATVAMTLDARADLDGSTWQPVLDDQARVNVSAVTRNGGTVQTYTDTASVTALGTLSDSVTTYQSADAAALCLAQWRVFSTVGAMRVPQVAVDLMTAQNSATIYTALASVTIGSLIQITNIPNSILDGTGATVRVFPTSILSGYVEGWSETIGIDRYDVVFDLSPVQPRFILENAVQGRLVETTGSMTLNGAITAVASSASIATSGSNPTLSTSAGDYPLYIKVDEEIIQLSVPGASVSPQTVGLTRGINGTFVDAHANGAAVTVFTGSLVL